MNWRDDTTKNTVITQQVCINMSSLASGLVQGVEYDQTCQMKSLCPQTMNSINEPSCILNIKGVHGYLEQEGENARTKHSCSEGIRMKPNSLLNISSTTATATDLNLHSWKASSSYKCATVKPQYSMLSVTIFSM